jgi:hypothetical protein
MVVHRKLLTAEEFEAFIGLPGFTLAVRDIFPP